MPFPKGRKQSDAANSKRSASLRLTNALKRDAVVVANKKLCSCCKQEKPLTAFSKKADGLWKSWCRGCIGLQYRNRRKAGWRQKKSTWTRFVDLRRDAEKRGYEFSLMFVEYEFLMSAPDCVYCGAEVSTGGLDRVEASVGYTFKNVVVSCCVCNQMKSDILTAAQMRQIGGLLKAWRSEGSLTLPKRLTGFSRDKEGFSTETLA